MSAAQARVVATDDAFDHLERVAEIASLALRGEPLPNLVNPQALQ